MPFEIINSDTTLAACRGGGMADTEDLSYLIKFERVGGKRRRGWSQSRRNLNRICWMATPS